MKRKIIGLLLSALLAANIPLAGVVMEAEPSPVTALLASMEASAQVLRSKPSQNADSLGYYLNGVQAQVAGAPEKGWVKVSIGSLTGYLKEEELILDPSPDIEAEELPVVQVAYQDGPSLTLRAAQSYQSEKMGGYPNGTEAQVMGFTEDFVHVIMPDGKVGFMMAWGVSPQMTKADVQEKETAPAQETGDKAGGQPEATDKPQPSAATPPPDTELISVYNAGGQGATLRAKSSTGSVSLGLYPNGSQVYLLKWGEWWCRIWADGKTGYMMTKMLNVQQPDLSGGDDFGN